MRIKDIQIDGFGIWNNLKLEELPPGVTVLYGPNEAGKTTLMQFVRTVLYGFSPFRRNRYLPPVIGGHAGGRLRVADGASEFVLQRSGGVNDREDDRGHVSVVDSQGLPRDPSQLSLLLAGVDEPTYSNVFACGLREIQELGTLDDTSAAEHLYKLTTGLDRVSLVDVMRELGSSRERLLSTQERPSQIVELVKQREKLQSEIEQLSTATRRWSELATQQAALTEEACELEDALEKTDAGHRLFEAGLQVQAQWNHRADVERQLGSLRDVKQLPERAVERLEALTRRISRLRRQVKKIAAKRKELRGEIETLEVNKTVLGHANRIEALGEQAQWITTLESQIQKLKDEIRNIDAEVERETGAKLNRPGELTAEGYRILKRPAIELRETTQKLEEAKREAEAAQREFEVLSGRFASSARNRSAGDLQDSVQTVGQRVALLRKRIQVEEKLDQLARRQEELEFEDDEMLEYQGLPIRITAALGILFSIGIMLIFIGIVAGMNNWVASSGPYLFFGVVLSIAAAGTKIFLERRTEEDIDDNRRQSEQVRSELAAAKQERDELDAELPAGGGALDARLREAESELRELERLSPLTTERQMAEQRHQLAQRKLAAAQEALKTAKARWQEALKGTGMPADFPLQKVKHVVKASDQVQEFRRRRDIRRDELEQREREMLVLSSRVQQLVGDVRLQAASDKPLHILRQLSQALAHEKEVLELRSGVVKKAQKLRRQRERCGQRIRTAARKRSALLQLAGVIDMPAFRQVAAEAAKAADLRRLREELTQKIQTALAGQFTEEQIAGLFAREGRDLAARWDQKMSHLHEVRTRLAGLHERRGACTHEMQQLASDRRLAVAQLELSQVEEQLKDAIRQWQVLAIIGRALDAVRESYETDRQPETLLEASKYLSQLTLGQYRRVWMPLDRRVLLVEDTEGKSLPLEVLSRGTREAIYVSLRLALAGSFARRGAVLPLVFDDVLVNLDTARVRAAAAVFREFAQEGHQILMFTCHEHIMRIFQESHVTVRTLPARSGIVVEGPMAIETPPVEVEKPKRKRHKAAEHQPEAPARAIQAIEKKPALELPPPLPPPVIPMEEEQPRRIPIDPNDLFARAAQDEKWFASTNEFELARQEPTPVSVPRPKLPDAWPLAPSPTVPPPVEEAPKPLTRIDPPATDRVIPQRARRFTWGSPEVYWEDEPQTVESTASPGRGAPEARDESWSGWDL